MHPPYYVATWDSPTRITLTACADPEAPALPWRGTLTIMESATGAWAILEADELDERMPGHLAITIGRDLAVSRYGSVACFCAYLRAAAASATPIGPADVAANGDGFDVQPHAGPTLHVDGDAVYQRQGKGRRRLGGRDPMWAFRAPRRLVDDVDADRRPGETRSDAIRRLLSTALTVRT